MGIELFVDLVRCLTKLTNPLSVETQSRYENYERSMLNFNISQLLMSYAFKL